ncbi:MAG: Benzylsuccinate synthase alpha subunit [candidate division BRC1 bacterium ADurb.BinA364]|nr:MAG: Benzylsuccinate synthase alpha subunit [candidate division BRC1 bacterium ADurb.BinA364]
MRWHRNISDELMNACFDCTVSGQNMPVFLNDEATPGGFMNLGIAREAAYDYTHVGCGELGISGKLQDSALGGSVGHISTLMQLLRQNRAGGKTLAGQFPRFDDLLDGLARKMRANAEAQAAIARDVGSVQAQFGQIPFTSAFMHGCIERARDLTVRAEYNFPNMNMGGGYSNFVNSMAAIRQLVYRDRVCDLDELFEAMQANFEGHERLLAAARRAPKFGNDDEDADDLIPVLERIHADAIDGLEGPRNRGRFITSGIDGASHMGAGANLMATPDGRLAGKPLAPGMSAAQGSTRNGLTALLNTVQKLDSQNHWFGGYTLNLRVTPDLLKGADSRKKMMDLLRVYFMGKGLNLHLNCVSTAMLREAQLHPEEHRDLVVRVSGYSEYFGNLSPEFQEEIISRAEEMAG